MKRIAIVLFLVGTVFLGRTAFAASDNVETTQPTGGTTQPICTSCSWSCVNGVKKCTFSPRNCLGNADLCKSGSGKCGIEPLFCDAQSPGDRPPTR